MNLLLIKTSWNISNLILFFPSFSMTFNTNLFDSFSFALSFICCFVWWWRLKNPLCFFLARYGKRYCSVSPLLRVYTLRFLHHLSPTFFPYRQMSKDLILHFLLEMLVLWDPFLSPTLFLLLIYHSYANVSTLDSFTPVNICSLVLWFALTVDFNFEVLFLRRVITS